MNEFLYKVKSVAIGHAVADALGVPVEFLKRETLQKNPVTKMMGYGTYNVPAGSWSDDTSMALCAMDALKVGQCIDWEKIMMNFCRWLNEGKYTPSGYVFDAGGTCVAAVNNYSKYGRKAIECGLADDMSNGNGSLMRIYPFVLYLLNLDMPIEEKIRIIEDASALTHAHERSKVGCGIYSFIMWELLDKPCISSVREGLEKAQSFYCEKNEYEAYVRLFSKIEQLSQDDIRSGGYVVDTLEAAVWCLLTTSSYEECVLKAVNLGSDTDTVAAIAGSMAGALYGYNAIPKEWINTLIAREYIEELCTKAFD